MKPIARADQLQFLRFLAFLLICVYHTGQFQFSWLPQANGAANAVAFFIVLSGFVSGYSSYQLDIECNLIKIVQYIWKKIKKVYPLYFVTMIVAIAFSKIPNLVATHSFVELKPQIVQLIKCLCLIQSWFPSGYFSFNGVGWFLSTILILYIFNLPLRALASKIKKLKGSDLIFILIFIVTSLLLFYYCYATRNTNMEYTQYILPISRIGEYICGLSLGYLAFSINSKLGQQSAIYLFVFSILEIISIVIWFHGMYTPMEAWHFRILHWFIPNCFLIMMFSFGKGILSFIFKIDFLRYLGDISFECFLLHPIVIKFYSTLCGIEEMSQLGNLFSMIFCVVTTIMIAMLISKQKIKKDSKLTKKNKTI